MSRVAIVLVRIAFCGDASASDVVTDHLDGTRANGDLRGAWRSAAAIAPHSPSPIGRVVRAARRLRDGREVRP